MKNWKISYSVKRFGEIKEKELFLEAANIDDALAKAHRDKIQTFVNDLKNDAKTDDKKVADLNRQLINEGEKTISNIDATH